MQRILCNLMSNRDNVRFLYSNSQPHTLHVDQRNQLRSFYCLTNKRTPASIVASLTLCCVLCASDQSDVFCSPWLDVSVSSSTKHQTIMESMKRVRMKICELYDVPKLSDNRLTNLTHTLLEPNSGCV